MDHFSESHDMNLTYGLFFGLFWRVITWRWSSHFHRGLNTGRLSLLLYPKRNRMLIRTIIAVYADVDIQIDLLLTGFFSPFPTEFKSAFFGADAHKFPMVSDDHSTSIFDLLLVYCLLAHKSNYD